MKNLKLLDLHINLFDGAAAAPAAGGDAGPAGTDGSPVNSQQGNSGGTQKVIYGKQTTDGSPSDAGKESKNDDPKEKARRYRELMDGEFRDLYTQDTQRIINQRFRETKTLQETLEAQNPIMQMLADRYGVNDPAELVHALEEDNHIWEQQADEAGMSVDQYRQYKRMERENAALRQAQQQAVNRERANRQVQAWVKDAEGVQKDYPQFDLKAETENPQFIRLLQSGIDMKHAYEVIHMEEIMNQTAQAAERKTVDNIRAKGARPREAGISSQTGVVTKPDVSKLTAADRREIAKRVAQGEEIIF